MGRGGGRLLFLGDGSRSNFVFVTAMIERELYPIVNFFLYLTGKEGVLK